MQMTLPHNVAMNFRQQRPGRKVQAPHPTEAASADLAVQPAPPSACHLAAFLYLERPHRAHFPAILGICYKKP